MSFVTVTCCNCGVQFQMTQEQNRDLHKCGNSFYCPNGHKQHYTNTDAKKIKDLEQSRDYFEGLAKRRLKEVQYLESRINAYKGHATRRRRAREA